MSQVEIDDAEWQNPDNWYLEFLYFSRRDSRPFVPKRGGSELLGATPNFAHPAGVSLLAGMLAFAVLLCWLNR